MSRPISFLNAVEGFWLQAQSRRLSEETIRGYASVFKIFEVFIGGETPVRDISSRDVQDFLRAHADRVGRKTLSNYYVALSALWTWMVRFDLVDEHILRRVARPQPEKPDILPYSDQDIRAILGALGRSKTYQREYGKVTHKLKHEDRHRAILFVLLDTGVRCSELCGVRLQDVDLKNQRIFLMGKGNKERSVPISARTGQVLWKYIAQEREPARPAEPLFVTEHGGGFNRRMLNRKIVTICERAGVKGATVHRFRHTFAINYLRHGGNVYSLQYILGHSTLEMVRRYLAIAQADVDQDHQAASPVMNLGL